jgi:hypothetical protein
MAVSGAAPARRRNYDLKYGLACDTSFSASAPLPQKIGAFIPPRIHVIGVISHWAFEEGGLHPLTHEVVSDYLKNKEASFNFEC